VALTLLIAESRADEKDTAKQPKEILGKMGLKL